MRAPRVCGDDPATGAGLLGRAGVLPAYAGMIRSLASWPDSDVCAPRVCGDDPVNGQLTTQATQVLPAYAGMIPEPRRLRRGLLGCSPRMRG